MDRALLACVLLIAVTAFIDHRMNYAAISITGTIESQECYINED